MFLGWRPGTPSDSPGDLWPEPQTVGARDPQPLACHPPVRCQAVCWALCSLGRLIRTVSLRKPALREARDSAQGRPARGGRADLEAGTVGHRPLRQTGSVSSDLYQERSPPWAVGGEALVGVIIPSPTHSAGLGPLSAHCLAALTPTCAQANSGPARHFMQPEARHPEVNSSFVPISRKGLDGFQDSLCTPNRTRGPAPGVGSLCSCLFATLPPSMIPDAKDLPCFLCSISGAAWRHGLVHRHVVWLFNKLAAEV